MIHKEAIVDRETLNRCLDTLAAVDYFVTNEQQRHNQQSMRKLSHDDYRLVLGEILCLETLMHYITPRLCEHRNIEFGDVEERGVCEECGATCDWHREIDHDDDTGQEIVEKIPDEWHLPSIEEARKQAIKDLGIKI